VAVIGMERVLKSSNLFLSFERGIISLLYFFKFYKIMKNFKSIKQQKTENIMIKVIFLLAFLFLLQAKALYGQGEFVEVADMPYVSTDLAFDQEGNRYVTLQQGVVFKNSDTLLTVDTWFQNEMGLVAVLPDENFVYLHYTGYDSTQRVVRYDTISQLIDTILEVPYNDPFTTIHHGGDLVKVDSFLYSSFGYGSWLNDAQDPTNYKGKVILTNLSNNSSSIYADGLRNPFRMAYDTLYGGIWVADVGSNIAEEVNFFYEGESGGWPCWEGDSLRTIEDTCWLSVAPIYHYSQAQPRYIIGGALYNYEYYWADAGSGFGGRIDSMGFNIIMMNQDGSAVYPVDLTSMAINPVTNQLFAINWIGEIFLYQPDSMILGIDTTEEEEIPEKPKDPPLWYADYCTGFIDIWGRIWPHYIPGQIMFDCQKRKRVFSPNE
jgi:hypothetical protein